jgi:hypothetical protein
VHSHGLSKKRVRRDLRCSVDTGMLYMTGTLGTLRTETCAICSVVIRKLQCEQSQDPQVFLFGAAGTNIVARSPRHCG